MINRRSILGMLASSFSTLVGVNFLHSKENNVLSFWEWLAERREMLIQKPHFETANINNHFTNKQRKMYEITVYWAFEKTIPDESVWKIHESLFDIPNKLELDGNLICVQPRNSIYEAGSSSYIFWHSDIVEKLDNKPLIRSQCAKIHRPFNWMKLERDYR